MAKEKGTCSLLRMAGIAVLLAAISFVLRMAEAIFTMDYYMNPAYFGVWSKLMMPVAGPPPIEFSVLSLAFAFVTAFIFTWFFQYLKPVLANGNWMKKGACFGLILFFICTVPSTLALILMINLPVPLLLAWAFTGLVISIMYGLVLAKLC
ncbi:MAG: hypothetical protein PHQ80_04680 [Candidatus ainarchaeum sp.]|nr:hypothetical protein [Candidatus ainarchaeum sp.]